ncbi:MAG: TonB-dependent receptor plug domain-containing protein, partial [Sphingomicrobium sp.]
MRISTALLLGTSLLAISTPAFAQTEQEDVAQAANPPADTPPTEVIEEGEIIVTATKRASRVQEVPFSINAQTEADLRRANAQTLEDISRNVAGLTVQNLGPGQSQVSVRGVSAGQIARDQPGVKEQVGIYLDETITSLSLFTPDFDLFDLNRVETLRGPQGTLFGSGSVGGTIRYITNQPDVDSFEGMVEANLNLVGDDDIGGHLKGMINAPIAEGVAIRAVGYYTQYGGFVDALREGGGVDEDINDGHRVG